MKTCLMGLIIGICACQPALKKDAAGNSSSQVMLVVLGTLQDGGSPHINCRKACCKDLFIHPDPSRKVVSLGLVDSLGQKTYLLEATPDISAQMQMLHQLAPFNQQGIPDGIFLTHAHIGHYSGLMFLGREAMDADSVPVYAMPRMTDFLKSNGPWSQLVNAGNILLKPLEDQQAVKLTKGLTLTPLKVPHRDEYSETVGYVIEGPSKRALFIPDIDKWEKWGSDIVRMIRDVDYAFIDATFYDAGELQNRDMSEIPHPFVVETMEKLGHLPAAEKGKVYFIHFNHTNPLLDPGSKACKTVRDNGFHMAEPGLRVGL